MRECNSIFIFVLFLDVIKKQYKYKNRITFPHVSTTNYIFNKNFLKKYNFNYPVKTGFEDLILTIVLDYIKNHNDVKIGFAKNMIVYYYVSSRTQDDFNRENRVIDIDEIYKTLAPDDNQGDTGISSIGNNMNLDEIYQSLSPDVGE